MALSKLQPNPSASFAQFPLFHLSSQKYGLRSPTMHHRDTEFMIPVENMSDLDQARGLLDPPARQQTLILLVDDDDTLRTIIQMGLERLGYAVWPAANGESALEAAAHHKEIQLLLTDVLMPGLSGVELAEQLRKTHPQIEVLYVSGHLQTTISALNVPLDSIHFLQKPFRSIELDDRIQTILSKRDEL
jgi:CheY-like chemotaxis protein